MHGIIDEIFRREAGAAPRRMKKLEGGSDNIVYRVAMADGDRVIRLHRDYAAMYRKEIWAMRQAGAAGVPVPDVLCQGSHGEFDYMIIDFVDGTVGSAVPGDASHMHRAAGRLARLVNEIPVTGFGRRFESEPQPHFRQSWREVVEEDIAYIFGDDTLQRLNIMSGDDIGKARRIIENMGDWTYAPRLSHADICPDNLIIDARGAVWLIDWSKCSGLPAPFHDVGDFAGWRDDEHRLSAFLDGYGMSRAEYLEMKPEMDAIGIAAVLRGVVWAKKDWPRVLDTYAARARQMTPYL